MHEDGLMRQGIEAVHGLMISENEILQKYYQEMMTNDL